MSRAFPEWFHKEHGPIDPKDGMARSMHRHARAWAHAAWIESRSRALYPPDDEAADADGDEFCPGCAAEPTVSELDAGRCDCCGKPFA